MSLYDEYGETILDKGLRKEYQEVCSYLDAHIEKLPELLKQSLDEANLKLKEEIVELSNNQDSRKKIKDDISTQKACYIDPKSEKYRKNMKISTKELLLTFNTMKIF